MNRDQRRLLEGIKPGMTSVPDVREPAPEYTITLNTPDGKTAQYPASVATVLVLSGIAQSLSNLTMSHSSPEGA